MSLDEQRASFQAHCHNRRTFLMGVGASIVSTPGMAEAPPNIDDPHVLDHHFADVNGIRMP